MEKRKIDAAVVGLGGNGWGTVQAALAADHIGRVVGVDINEEQCRKAASELNIAVTTSLDEVLDDDRIELIYISANNSAHYPIGKLALERGKKVCMEKPMGVTLAETEDLLRIVKKTGGFLHVGFELRHFSKLYTRIKEILDSGEIGRLRHINCQYSLSPFGTATEAERWKYKRELSGGLFQEKLCHYIDLPRWWDGTRVCRYFVTKAENVIPYYQISDNFELTYQFESGVVSHLSFLTGAAGEGECDLIDTELLERQEGEGYRLSYQVVGSEGALEANVFRRQLRVFHHPGKSGLNGKSKMVRMEKWKHRDDHLWFHNTTDEKKDVARRAALGLPPVITPEDAAETMRLCFEFEEAATQPWKVVERGGLL